MEFFRGSLAHHRLSFLMPALLEGRVLEGSLCLDRGALHREFHFRDGCLVFASSNEPTEHLAQVLVDLKILEGQVAASTFEAAHAARKPYGELLVERGFVDRNRLIDALEHKAREAFFDCYGWESGELSFTPQPSEGLRGVGLKLKAGPLHRDAMARLREWKAFREIFPEDGARFEVYRECAVEWGTEAEEALMTLSEGGASLGELLASTREGPVFTSRRLLQMYRRGVLSPRVTQGAPIGGLLELEQLVALARSAFHAEEFERAAAISAQALERAPVPEAHHLYRQAEEHLTFALRDRLLEMEGRLVFEPLPRPAPPQLTADDLYLYSRLKAARSLGHALRSAAMGELAACRSMQRLMDCGVLYPTGAPSTLQRHRTEPQFCGAGT